MKTFCVLLIISLLCFACNTLSNGQQEERKILFNPLEDGIHVNVYTFIGRFLEEQETFLDPKAVQEWYEEEKRSFRDPSHKPHIAEIYEGEIAGLLRVLLLKDPRYQNITLYGRDGVGLATSGMRQDNLTFDTRLNGLALGFLTNKILSTSQVYRYVKDKLVYEEYILPIYKKSSLYYTDLLPKQDNKGVLIGYLSYIVCAAQSPLKNQLHGR